MNEATEQTPSNSNRADQAYLQLRSDIVHGVLRPNERLIEEEIAERLQISRTPIRESFKRLAAEGLIVNRRRGWLVYEHTLDEIRQIYETRMALEGYAASLAAERASEAELLVIKTVFLSPHHFLGEAARETLVIENEKFHDVINHAAGNQKLIELLRQTHLFYFNTRIAALYAPTDIAEAREHHAAIVKALLNRDSAAAERAIRHDIATALKLILGRMR
ncbi:MAG: GntR family transcriptional regulator [Anaerolineae bacterium]|nr:GntR family transcriptional regulator [Anaerolineae bacterium]